MATNTPKLNLVKPDLNDNVDIDVLNGNMDILDDAITTIPAFSGLSGVSLTSPVAGQKLVFDGTNWVNLTGYQYVQTIYYTSNGTFTKADYPWLRAIRVRMVGGGAGGARGNATENWAGGGGASYSESFITDIAALGASVTVTRAAGGNGATTNSTAGSVGGVSSFGTLVTASGGAGSGLDSVAGGVGNGDIVIRGDAGEPGAVNATGSPGEGGSSVFGGRSGSLAGGVAGNAAGRAGQLYGGGGGAGRREGNGGNGAPGIVIVELYA